MADKTFLFVMVLFIAGGIFSYDYYVKEKGGISPVGKLVDFVGLSDSPKDSGDEKESVTRKSFSFNSNQRLEILRAKHLEIAAQRMKLVENRSAILSQLIVMNDQLEDEVQEYIMVIEKERGDFMKRFPELQKIGQAAIMARHETDPLAKESSFQEIENTLMVMGEELGVKNELDDVLMNIKSFLNSEDNLDRMEEQVLDIEDQLMSALGQDEFESYMIRKEELMKMNELIGVLKVEYQQQIDTAQIGENSFQESQQDIEGKFKNLVKQLVAVTENDLQDLIFLYKELQVEHDMVLNELDINHGVSYDKSVQINRQIQDMIMSKVFQDNFTSIATAYKSNQEKQKNLIEEDGFVVDQMYQAVNEYTVKNEASVHEIARLMDVDVQKLVNDREYAIAKSRTYFQDRKVQERILQQRRDVQADPLKVFRVKQLEPIKRLDTHVVNSRSLLRSNNLSLRTNVSNSDRGKRRYDANRRQQRTSIKRNDTLREIQRRKDLVRDKRF